MVEDRPHPEGFKNYIIGPKIYQARKIRCSAKTVLANLPTKHSVGFSRVHT